MSVNFSRTILLLFFAITLCAPAPLFAALSVNVNSADMEQLQQIKGIGPKTAEKIVAYRDKNGKYSSVDELCNIKGIGEKSLEKMAGHMTVQ